MPEGFRRQEGRNGRAHWVHPARRRAAESRVLNSHGWAGVHGQRLRWSSSERTFLALAASQCQARELVWRWGDGGRDG